LRIVLMSAFKINDKEFHNVLPIIKVDAFLEKPESVRLRVLLEHLLDTSS
jgi:hypothetical protein